MYIEFDDDDVEIEPDYCVCSCTMDGYTKYFSNEDYSICVEEFLKFKKELSTLGGGSIAIYQYDYSAENDADIEKLVKFDIV